MKSINQKNNHIKLKENSIGVSLNPNMNVQSMDSVSLPSTGNFFSQSAGSGDIPFNLNLRTMSFTEYVKYMNTILK